MTTGERDHGGGLDAAIAKFGGNRIGWIDLSTGINPHPYPVSRLPSAAWAALPDTGAAARLEAAARSFWQVPDMAALLAAPGASAVIAQIPQLLPRGTVCIPGPTYNEHAAAFAAHGWQEVETAPAIAQVVVHPNNPDGTLWTSETLPARDATLTVIDESFCDVDRTQSLISLADSPGTLVLKSFGKFWGLAGLRLGFVAGDPALITRLRERLGPWAVSGPALHLGVAALTDPQWARDTRTRLAEDAARLDALMQIAGARVLGGTTLFRLYEVTDASAWQTRLASHRIWSRVFPYNPRWLRLGLPHRLHWPRLEAALA
ncbi:threonine-phosphate decarboxylase CobD [uncultured Roseobacter sp.]|uniref:threonine-phosphate decarboxylase CobD n=1 Tax=uncultured Roseobacter sp. TaxID=114847 RepID=UPI0026359B5F|nr:threonine-phosphate decarboxylase CobD [uncultured Roseobacter sp.]